MLCVSCGVCVRGMWGRYICHSPCSEPETALKYGRVNERVMHPGADTQKHKGADPTCLSPHLPTITHSLPISPAKSNALFHKKGDT